MTFIQEAELKEIISNYTNKLQESEIKGQAEDFYRHIKPYIQDNLKKHYFSGSFAKGTNISLGSDCDIFLSYSSSYDGRLDDLYNYVYSGIEQAIDGYNSSSIRKKNVSIGIDFNGLSIDIIPAKRQSQHGGDHSLFSTKRNSWIKTNVVKHINYVKNSRRIKEIKLAKI